ncbi:NADH:ubiquinone reductase (Na(+)-transporting) subunit F [Microscilla marina]|uniref:Na(+)-translocating NADH-quinone reductase subunit F n=1 Tax=Microscilla marina ATCC 23134 TaxID=313606 RepID=A1ZKH9_MICM2|nr:NADH:ubiquinone reductase (Na(+)-transporting) subunit F [Microscilla marina]EAY29205.1 NADH:ubiquinone oxidoreductase, na(+)-translocating, f subunit [Microscilla marina ATCC 23134]
MTITIVAAIAAFSLVILLLVFLLLFAQSYLVQSGPVKIIINGDEENPVEVSAGSTLLTTLSNQSMFLPSACGGGGTCAMCKCQVLDGGGDVLPTEVPHLSRQEQKENVRLACQVKVKQDMRVGIPEEIFGIKKWDCEVVSNYNVATFIKEFVVKLPDGETLDFDPGGYIQIDVPEITVDFKTMDIKPHPDDPAGPDKFKPDWDKFNLWPLKMVNDEPIFRAYSMANHPAEGNIIMLNIRIATPPWDRAKNDWMAVNPGICSSYVFSCKPGDKVTISGPYGEFHINPTDREMIYIGGGAGMAPLRSHLFHLFHTEKTKHRKVSYWYGGRSKRELFYTDHFRKIEEEYPNFKYNIALSEPMEEDNWDGYQGFIHQVLYDNYLQDHPEPDEIEFYFCGPPMMNAAVIKMLDDMGIPDENIRFDDFG